MDACQQVSPVQVHHLADVASLQRSFQRHRVAPNPLRVQPYVVTMADKGFVTEFFAEKVQSLAERGPSVLLVQLGPKKRH
jgi:hypothetical protein